MKLFTCMGFSASHKQKPNPSIMKQKEQQACIL